MFSEASSANTTLREASQAVRLGRGDSAEAKGGGAAEMHRTAAGNYTGGLLEHLNLSCEHLIDDSNLCHRADLVVGVSLHCFRTFAFSLNIMTLTYRFGYRSLMPPTPK